MARPRKSPSDQKQIYIGTRVSPAEADSFHQKVEAAGVTASALLRNLIAQTPLPRRSRRQSSVQHADELAKVLREIGRIGNNVNQMAHVANAGSWPAAQAVEQARDDIQWMRQALMKALGYPAPGSTPSNEDESGQ